MEGTTKKQWLSGVDSFSCSPISNPHVFRPWKRHGRVSLHLRPLALSHVCSWSGGAPEGYSLSMSLYFFLSMDTWSLKRTGSSLIWEWTSGMLPNQLANLFMQVWRWAKWSGSAQRDARELWERETTSNELWIQHLTALSGLPSCWQPSWKKINSRLQTTHLSHHGLFVLFLLSDLYGW